MEERALYVATDFTFWEEHDPKYLGKDLEINGKCYRSLDATYYAYLRALLCEAKKRKDQQQLAEDAFTYMMDQFGMIFAWALEWIGEIEMKKAVAEMTRPKAMAYQEPRPLAI